MWSNKGVKILNENVMQLLIIKCGIILKNLLCKIYAFISRDRVNLKNVCPDFE